MNYYYTLHGECLGATHCVLAIGLGYELLDTRLLENALLRLRFDSFKHRLTTAFNVALNETLTAIVNVKWLTRHELRDVTSLLTFVF